MRFMIIVKATQASEAGELPKDALTSVMATYHEELVKAGVLLDAAGLRPSSSGWRVYYSRGRGSVVDGPFTQTKDLVAGYTLIQVRSKEEAMEWARRFPAPWGETADCEIEVRQLYEADDFGPGRTAGLFAEMDQRTS
jgi:hypothetical protein